MVVRSGSNTDYKSSEPHKTLVMLCYCYVMLCYCYVIVMLCYVKLRPRMPETSQLLMYIGRFCLYRHPDSQLSVLNEWYSFSIPENGREPISEEPPQPPYQKQQHQHPQQ